MTKLTDEIVWGEEHELFKGTYFGHWRGYTLMKGALSHGGYSIGGKFDGEYDEIDVDTIEELNAIMEQVDRGVH